MEKDGAAPASTTSPLNAAWKSYLSMLDEMRALVESTSRFQETPQHRAKAYHTLMEVQAFAYNWAIAPRQYEPRIFRHLIWQTNIYTLAQNNPDTFYEAMFVDGRQSYRLSGRMGDVVMATMQTHNGLPGIEGGKPIGQVTAHYDWAGFDVAADGTFKIVLSANQHTGNWIKLNPELDVQCLLLRRMFPNWLGDPGELRLEWIDKPADHYYDAEEFEERAMAARIRRAESLVRYMTTAWNVGLYDMYLKAAAGRRNVMTTFPGTEGTFSMSSRTMSYAMGVFELNGDEVLIVEIEHPDGIYWSCQLGDVWGRSLPFGTRQTSLNNLQAVPDRDGVLRFVVSQTDPGVANWLDVCGRTEGEIVFRNFGGSAPVAHIRREKFSTLNDFLPRDTVRLTPAQRADAIETRRLGQLQMWG
ncbi:MAG: hypothetical protein ABW034_00275 [Steroidobacteraceae bacterium]